jgi:hypothetical protein
MPVSPKLEQHPTQVVSLDGWQPDDDFPFAPQGAKPKRIFICPNPPPHPFLIGGHKYIFKEPAGTHVQQIWSEVIAYELSRDLRLPVPPAFLAAAPGNGSPGVLIEFFYGYSGDPEYRLVHAVERLQGTERPIDFRCGSLKDNITVCRLHQIQNWRDWWARTLSFDAIIGNTDRHSENWGFLTRNLNGSTIYSLAPAFDNGTSLGYIIKDQDIDKYIMPNYLDRLVERGSHHCGWITGDRKGAQHARLCRTFRNYALHGTMRGMDTALKLSDDRIGRLVAWCTAFSYAVPFTAKRGAFVAAQLKARRDALAVALGA